MAEKDVTEKTLEAYNDVFADIVNVLLFDGKPLVSPDSLTDAQPASFYALENRARWQERDVAKYWNDHFRIRLALIGFENQTEIDEDMPFRVISYDGAAYRAQLTEGRERYPVVTLVLYFGRRHWTKRKLSDRLNVPEPLKPYVHDYEANVFEIAYLTEAQLEQFHSDFQIVADYFVRSRTDPDYRPKDPRRFEHTNELLRLMSAVTGDGRYADLIHAEGGAPSNMCEVLDRVEKRGIEQGRAVGLAEGRAEGRAVGKEEAARAFAMNLRNRLGMTDPAQVARLVNMPAELVEHWFQEGR